MFLLILSSLNFIEVIFFTTLIVIALQKERREFEMLKLAKKYCLGGNFVN